MVALLRVSICLLGGELSLLPPKREEMLDRERSLRLALLERDIEWILNIKRFKLRLSSIVVGPVDARDLGQFGSPSKTAGVALHGVGRLASGENRTSGFISQGSVFNAGSGAWLELPCSDEREMWPDSSYRRPSSIPSYSPSDPQG